MRAVALIPTARLDTLWLDDGGRVQAASFNDATLTGVPDQPAESLISPPVAVASGPDRLEVFGIDPGCSLIHWTYTPGAQPGSRWSAAEVIGANMSSTPAAVASGGNQVDLFCLGADRGMLHTRFSGSWSAWDELGGGFTSEPVVLAGPAGMFDIFARGFDFVVYHASWKPGSPADWQPLGGGLLGEPSAASAPAAVRVNNGILVFLTTAAGDISYAEFDGTVWKPWASLGQAQAATDKLDTVNFVHVPVVVARSHGITVPPRPVTGTPERQGPLAGGPPSLITGDTRVDVFGVGSDGALWQNTLDAQGWNPHWATLGGKFACAPSIAAPSEGVHAVDQPPVRYALAVPQGNGPLHVTVEGSIHRWWFGPTVNFPAGAWTEVEEPAGWPSFRMTSQYQFEVDKIEIDKTRSPDSDTLVITVALKAGNRPLRTLSYAFPRDYGTGIIPWQGPGFGFPGFVELAEPVVFVYAIVNSHDSGDQATVTGIVVKAIDDVLNDAFKSAAWLAGAILGAGLGWLTDKLLGFAFGGCDGLVAAEAITYRSGRDLHAQIASHGAGTPRTFETSTRNLRADYPSGCQDSSYLVGTSIAEL